MIDLRAYRLHLIGALLVLISVLLILVYVVTGKKNSPAPTKKAPTGISADFAAVPVPATALYAPEEPELLPKVILSQPKRTVWTEKDALPFWTNPAKIDQFVLENAAKKTVDTLFADIR